MAENSGFELRKHARFELFEYAMIRVEGRNDPIRSVITDISIGGTQVRCRHEIPSGLTCTLEMNHPETGEQCVVHAEVRYCNTIPDSDLWGVGFRFTPATADERVTIVRYVHGFFKVQGELLLGDDEKSA